MIRNLPAYFAQSLKNTISSTEAKAMARIVMEELTGRRLADLLADNDSHWTSDQIKRIEEIIEALKSNEPFQYIMGFADFMDLRFAVKPGVLIPRGETEELVNWIVGDLKKSTVEDTRRLQILDIGCGSGIIGICLAKEYPFAKIICADKHKLPLQITAENALINKVEIEVREMDALNPGSEWFEESFDVIVSNPPYVMDLQKESMKANVLNNEPESALFVSDDEPLVFYEQICKYASKALSQNGVLYFEINDMLGDETKSLVSSYFSGVELRKDIHGKDRMIKACNGY